MVYTNGQRLLKLLMSLQANPNIYFSSTLIARDKYEYDSKMHMKYLSHIVNVIRL